MENIEIFRCPFVFMENELPRANWKDRILYLLGRRRVFLVEGESMQPTLKSGDTVLIEPNTKIEPGDLVLANHPYKSNVKILKRVAEISSGGDLILVGDNAAESTDSRSFGSISNKHLVGKVVCRLK